MREKEEQRELRKYTYALLRVRLPDGFLLQGVWPGAGSGQAACWQYYLAHALYPTGTFYARERLPVLFQFVREALQNDWLPFELRASGGHRLVEDQALALNECGLVSWGVLHRF